MIKWLLYLLFTPLLTPAERATIKQYYKERRQAFVCEHILAGPELSKQLDELDKQLDEEERSNER